jgi:hypothetical protein
MKNYIYKTVDITTDETRIVYGYVEHDRVWWFGIQPDAELQAWLDAGNEPEEWKPVTEA